MSEPAPDPAPLGQGRLLHGDCLRVMDSLLEEGLGGGVDLIATDPPFSTGKEQRRGEVAYGDTWPSREAYLAWLREVAVRCHALLRETGSLFLHLDWRVSHLARALLDEIFGEGGEASAPGFRNEIIWCYTGPGSPRMRQFNRKHDVILWHSRGSAWTFNASAVRLPHSEKTRANFRRDIVGSGFTNPGYELDGDGKVPEDWWELPVAARFPVDGLTRVGYPTEKPVALVERIVRAASDPDDLVFDPLCGGGTVPFVAARLGRRWLACDVRREAVEMTRGRLERLGATVEVVENV